ncbi:unnamed protein product [Blepharisma stoltei]|uniref:Uncharacterized protein n=1 Tax=Blepharisma stoltei TaxID=1481888 RepID=A0AAU9J0F0_9CILI|nr:unnamed protein product [Blepharisma stoltei]
MQNQATIETDFLFLKERVKGFNKYLNRLKNAKKTIDNELPYSYRQSVPKFKSPLKVIHTDYSYKNVILYGRLCDIAQTKSPYRHENLTPGPRSLNLSTRKNEAKRVYTQNNLLAKRLVGTEASLSIKQLEKDYKTSQRYRSQISKSKKLGQIKKLLFQSPSLSDRSHHLSTSLQDIRKKFS